MSFFDVREVKNKSELKRFLSVNSNAMMWIFVPQRRETQTTFVAIGALRVKTHFLYFWHNLHVKFIASSDA